MEPSQYEPITTLGKRENHWTVPFSLDPLMGLQVATESHERTSKVRLVDPRSLIQRVGQSSHNSSDMGQP